MSSKTLIFLDQKLELNLKMYIVMNLVSEEGCTFHPIISMKLFLMGVLKIVL